MGAIILWQIEGTLALFIGIFLICKGLWLLRSGVDQKKFLTYMLLGFIFIFIIPSILRLCVILL